ncbi:sec-independent protein translocase protein TATB, chloroplastic [Andrographis paniculata]|uniref:sec-independent protein translocase protein TATB, chloroplastic n=1 Tax=Andrographis paniculata TaxID=175694 RepID=UPI0021E7ABE5|nr:sec-independent protein translocase protein TATB, chloroplastic [Andrographis paniculata]
MASAISIPTPFLSRSSAPYIENKPSPSLSLYFSSPKQASPQLSFAPYSQWVLSVRKQLGIISIPKFSARMRRKGRGKKHSGAYASLFGVGAPEFLVIGVVALLVFGPKGLAEAARSLGKTIRSFQPTIRELQEVSREFKSSLEREIGLDEVDSPSSNRFGSNTTSSTSDESMTNANQSSTEDPAAETGAYTADEYLKVTEAQLKAAMQDQIQPQTPSDKTPPKRGSDK